MYFRYKALWWVDCGAFPALSDGLCDMQKVKQSCCETLPQNSTRNGKRSWHCWQVDNEELIAAARVEAGN